MEHSLLDAERFAAVPWRRLTPGPREGFAITVFQSSLRGLFVSRISTQDEHGQNCKCKDVGLRGRRRASLQRLRLHGATDRSISSRITTRCFWQMPTAVTTAWLLATESSAPDAGHICAEGNRSGEDRAGDHTPSHRDGACTLRRREAGCPVGAVVNLHLVFHRFHQRRHSLWLGWPARTLPVSDNVTLSAACSRNSPIRRLVF
jgi:hypothetical protein